MNKGPLVVVRHPDGHSTKMYESDAVELGLIQGAKSQPAPSNKMAQPAEDKVSAKPTEPDDFSTIEGVGPAAARSIVANGITTFAQLKAARDVSFLSKKTRAAIEAWIDG